MQACDFDKTNKFVYPVANSVLHMQPHLSFTVIRWEAGYIQSIAGPIHHWTYCNMHVFQKMYWIFGHSV